MTTITSPQSTNTPGTPYKPSAWRRFRAGLTPYLYLLPAFIVMAVITYYPLGYQVYMSFTKFEAKHLKVTSPAPPWAGDFGLDNYKTILQNKLPNVANFNFLDMLGFNLFWTLTNVVLHVAIGIVIAVILNTEGLWGRGIYRAIYILPIVIPQIVVASVFRNMYDPQYGAINQMLAWVGGLFGLDPKLFQIRWIDQIKSPFADTFLAQIPFIGGMFTRLTLSYFALLICNVWLGWPFMTIVATGALQSIPKDLYEAASIDGANAFDQFWSITLPLLRPAMIPAAVFGLIATFNLYGLIYFLTGGGPVRQTEILLTMAFNIINSTNPQYGIAAAFCIYIFFILLAMTIFTNRVTRATESYDA